MKYKKQLPPVRHLLSLAQDTLFPVSREEIEQNAPYYGFSDEVVNFLRLFPADEIFSSRVDFMTRCEELEMYLTLQRESPRELLRNSPN